MNKLIHTPEGVRDIFGRECDKKRYLERQIEKLFRSYGYQSIETPTFEFFDVFSREVGTTASKDLYKLVDREGNTLVLRPDFTPSVGRAAAMYFSREEMPIRFCYHGNVFNNNSRFQGRLKESTQMGVELLNDSTVEADAEILALVVSIMHRCSLPNFQVSIGHVEFFRAIAEEAGMDEEAQSQLREFLSSQNRFGAEEMISRLNLRSDLRDAFMQMPSLFGGPEVFDAARKLTGNGRALAAVDRLEDIYGLLELHGCAQYVTFDFGLMTEYSYYTGIILQAFTYGSGDALITGGRYGRLLEYFGKKADSIGFAVKIDALLSALDRQGIQLPVADIKTMVLYPSELEELAIRFSSEQRAKNLDVACIRFERGKVLDNYREYGMRNQFGGIIYIRSRNEAYAINLLNGATEKIDLSSYLQETEG